MSEAVSSNSDSKEERIDFNRISLREIDPSDVDDLMVWSSDEKVTEYCTWEPYTSKQVGIDFIKKIPTTFSWYRVICLDNRAIGSISVPLHSGEDKCRAKTAEVGYILAADYWGKGIVTHVLKQVGKIIFSMYSDIERLEALTDFENIINMIGNGEVALIFMSLRLEGFATYQQDFHNTNYSPLGLLPPPIEHGSGGSVRR